MKTLLRCPHCHSIFKIDNTEINEDNLTLYTDMGGKFEVDYMTKMTTCELCKQPINFNDNSMETEDWIANMVFTIKGK